MRFLRWIGHSGTSAVIAAQLGLAMMPSWSPMRRALISGITSGTAGSIRNAEELSTTTAPAFAAAGAKRFAGPLPAENSTMSTPSKEFSVSSSMTIFWPRKSTVLPAERALASGFSLPTGKSRLFRQAMNSVPTAPVTPAIATVGFFFVSRFSVIFMAADPMDGSAFRQRGKHGEVPHLAPRPRLALAVEVQRAGAVGVTFPGIGLGADDVLHDCVGVAGGVAQRPAADGADVLLELAHRAGLDRPVPGIVHPGRDLVDHERTVAQHEQLHRQHADVVERLGDPAGDRLGRVGLCRRQSPR